MKHKYGNLIRAFRLGLDTDGNGELTKCEFGPAVRAEGFEGNLRRLWSELDIGSTGKIQMHAWTPEESPILREFQEYLVGNYETAETAWLAMCKYKQTYLKLGHFVEACKHIGFEGNAAAVHDFLRGDPGASKFVVQRDIVWLGGVELGSTEETDDDA